MGTPLFPAGVVAEIRSIDESSMDLACDAFRMDRVEREGGGARRTPVAVLDGIPCRLASPTAGRAERLGQMGDGTRFDVVVPVDAKDAVPLDAIVHIYGLDAVGQPVDRWLRVVASDADRADATSVRLECVTHGPVALPDTR